MFTALNPQALGAVCYTRVANGYTIPHGLRVESQSQIATQPTPAQGISDGKGSSATRSEARVLVWSSEHIKLSQEEGSDMRHITCDLEFKALAGS